MVRRVSFRPYSCWRCSPRSSARHASRRRRDRTALVRNTRTGRRGGAAVDRHELPASVYAIGCTLADIQSRSLDGRMSLEVHGSSATGRPMYKVVINQLQTDAQQASFDHWTTLRRQALSNPRRGAAAAPRLARPGQGAALHPGQHSRERVRGRRLEHAHHRAARNDAVRRRPRGGRDPRRRDRDLQRDPEPGRPRRGHARTATASTSTATSWTQSQSETKASVRIMQEWLPPETIDLHLSFTPTLVEATTKPHNPGIDYDLWLKWNQSRIDANEAALNAVNLNVTRPINDWCSDGSVSVQGAICPDGSRRPGGRRELGRLGPVLHADVLAARRPERLNGRGVLQRRPRRTRSTAATSTQTRTRRRTRSAATRRCCAHDVTTGRRSSTTRRTGTTCSTTSSRSTGAASPARRPACCPAPFDVENNWMHEFPTAYVIPVGAGQRSNPEANRLVDWLLFNGIEVRQLRSDAVDHRPGRRGGLLRRRHGAGPPGPRRDGARDRRRRLQPDRHPLRAARGVEPRLPLGRRRAAGAERRAVHGQDDAADREAVVLGGGVESGRPTTRSRSTRRPRCGR